MGKAKRLERLARQQKLLKNFTEDRYTEMKIGGKWYIKMFNGATKRWQVAVYTPGAFKNYKEYTLNYRRTR